MGVMDDSMRTEGDLLRVREVVEHFVAARTRDDPEDLVQEAMARLLESRDRLEPEAWAPYAVVTARNLLVNRERQRNLADRQRHRLHVPEQAEPADDPVLLAEQHDALLRAVGRLPEADRRLLRTHYADDDAERTRSVTGAQAARLARARARLRVDYLLEHGRVRLPSAACRGVLEALSAGDRRRQERLDAAGHLLSCPTCAAHGPALVERSRARVGMGALAWPAVLAALVWQEAKAHPVTSTVTAATVAAGLGGAAVLAGTGPAPAPAPAAAPPTVAVDRRAVLPDLPAGALPTGTAVATDVPVSAVPADEGFWVGTGPGHRLWVQLRVVGGESPVAVRPGDVVSFTGVVARLPAGFAGRVGLTGPEGAAELERAQGYLDVAPGDLRVRHP